MLARRYEVQGEYVIPPNATIPLSAADMALVTGVAGGTTAAQRPPFEQSGSGRWRVQAWHSHIQAVPMKLKFALSCLECYEVLRGCQGWLASLGAPAKLPAAAHYGWRTASGHLNHQGATRMLECERMLSPPSQVNVPGADLGEILPAARLLSRATALTPTDYERAKGLFLAGVDRAGLAAEVLAESSLHSGPPSSVDATFTFSSYGLCHSVVMQSCGALVRFTGQRHYHSCRAGCSWCQV